MPSCTTTSSTQHASRPERGDERPHGRHVQAPSLDSIDVHEWLERVEDDIDVGSQGTSPLATVCAAAVDPLEIAVALEVAGISHAVATGRYNRADVFSIARTLWGQIPLRPVPTAAACHPGSGNRSDLARGLLYALPAVMLLALTSAFDLSLAPLGSSAGDQLGLGPRPGDRLRRLPHAGRCERKVRDHDHGPRHRRRGPRHARGLDVRGAALRRRRRCGRRRVGPRDLHGRQRNPADARRREVAGDPAGTRRRCLRRRARDVGQFTCRQVARGRHHRRIIRSPSCSRACTTHTFGWRDRFRSLATTSSLLPAT